MLFGEIFKGNIVQEISGQKTYRKKDVINTLKHFWKILKVLPNFFALSCNFSLNYAFNILCIALFFFLCNWKKNLINNFLYNLTKKSNDLNNI